MPRWKHAGNVSYSRTFSAHTGVIVSFSDEACLFRLNNLIEFKRLSHSQVYIVQCVEICV